MNQPIQGSMPLKIEPAGEYDVPEILPMIQEYFPYVNMDFEALLRRLHYPWIYLEKSLENDMLTGYSDWEIIDKKNKVVRLNGLAVWPAYRGRGHAIALLESGENWARKKGVEKITLLVAKTNKDAKELYKKRGYMKIGMHPKKINGKISEVWEKKISC